MWGRKPAEMRSRGVLGAHEEIAFASGNLSTTFEESVGSELMMPYENNDELTTWLNIWGKLVGVVGIGQLSIGREPYTAIGKFIIHYREATTEEIERDVQELGEQVVGPLAEEATGEAANNQRITIWGERRIYVGPPRPEKVSFVTRVLPTGDVNGLVGILEEIDERAPTGYNVVPQAYHRFEACEGEISYASAATAKQLESEPLGPHGTIAMNHGRLTFTTDDMEGDMSEFIFRTSIV